MTFPKDFDAFMFPHHDIDDGKLVTVKSGVIAAMGAIDGARGGTDIPDSDKAKVRAHLARHYAQWGGEVPEKGKSMAVTTTSATSNKAGVNVNVSVSVADPQTNQVGIVDMSGPGAGTNAIEAEGAQPPAGRDGGPTPTNADRTASGTPTTAATGDGVGDEQTDQDGVLSEDVVPSERKPVAPLEVVDSQPDVKPDKGVTTTGGSGNAGGAGAINASGPNSGNKSASTAKPQAPAPEVKDAAATATTTTPATAPAPAPVDVKAAAKVAAVAESNRLFAEYQKTLVDLIEATL